MIPQYLHNAFASFCYWADNYLLVNGQAYRNHYSRLYSQDDPTLGSSYVVYASPFKQWVADNGASGAWIATGVTGPGINLVRGQSGLKIDYNNGRVILPAALGKGLHLSGRYAFKDFNFYLSDETEEALLVNEKFQLNSRTKAPPASGVEPYSYVTPCVFATVLDNSNAEFALGGEKLTSMVVSLVVYAETTWQMNGIISIFSDAECKHFPFLTATGAWWNEFGDVKTGLYPSGYNYTDLKSATCQPGNLLYIESVRASRLSEKTPVNPDVFAGIIQFEISKVRTT